jgi:hypothetical protein
MPKRHSANYSLWPEQARPHRSTRLAFAVSGFAIGVVCVVAAYNAFLDTGIAGHGQEPPALNDFEHAPIFAEPAVPLETASHGSRPRAPAAKVTLPIIGSVRQPGVATDGRGGAEPAGSVAALEASSGNPESLIHEGDHSTPQSVADEEVEEAKPAPTTVRKKIDRKKRKTIVRKKRKKVARKSRQPTRYRKRYGNSYLKRYGNYNLVSETDIWY